MNRTTAAALTLPFLVAACGTAATVETTETNLPTPTSSFAADRAPAPDVGVVSAGTRLLVQVEHHLAGFDDAEKLDMDVEAAVLEPVIAADGRTVIPAGAKLHGTVEAPIEPDRVPAALMEIDFHTLEVNGTGIPVATTVRTVDLALFDDDSSIRWPGVVPAMDPDAAIPGAIVYDPEWQQSELRDADLTGTLVSLGPTVGNGFPYGPRMVVEIIQDTPLR